jgi:indoleamine 2,3-dioxygenase
MPTISADSLFGDERRLRRAHVTLTYVMHFYIHSAEHDTASPIPIPSPLAVPLVAVSRELGVPPILTYADTVLWNWKLNIQQTPAPPVRRLRSNSALPALGPPSTDISTRTSFTCSPDENHFYMTSALIELRGVEALGLMRRTLDETFLSDAVAARRVTGFLTRLARVIEDITQLILDVKKHCDPGVFYGKIRPWFHGATAHGRMGWKFEGVELSDREKQAWGVLSGPSAGQSSLVHALDVFLGVDHTQYRSQTSDTSSSSSSSATVISPASHSHAAATSASTPAPTPTTSSSTSSSTSPHPLYASPDATFLQRMQQYMPRHHRAFLQYLGTVEKPVRPFVTKYAAISSPQQVFRSFASPSTMQVVEGEGKSEAPLKRAYNDAVDALRRFRDAHIRIAALYIVTQSKKQCVIPTEAPSRPSEASREATPKSRATGTGGTQLVPFLKGARDNTLRTTLQ